MVMKRDGRLLFYSTYRSAPQPLKPYLLLPPSASVFISLCIFISAVLNLTTGGVVTVSSFPSGKQLCHASLSLFKQLIKLPREAENPHTFLQYSIHALIHQQPPRPPPSPTCTSQHFPRLISQINVNYILIMFSAPNHLS